MRDHAASKGFSLSDSSLERTKLHTVPPEEISQIEAYEPIKTEEDIFRALHLDYIPPTERASKAYELQTEK